MKANRTHVIVLIVFVMMLFGSMGITVFATDEAASDNNAAATEQLIQDEAQPDAVVQETAPAKAKAAASKSKAVDGVKASVKAKKGAETATGAETYVLTFYAGANLESAVETYVIQTGGSVYLSALTALFDGNQSAQQIDYAATIVPSGLSKAQDKDGNWYVQASNAWVPTNKGTIEFYSYDSGGRQKLFEITVECTDYNAVIEPPEVYKKRIYNAADQQLIKTAGKASDATMEYAWSLASSDKPTSNWTSEASSITRWEVGSYTVWYRVIGSNGKQIGKAKSVATTASIVEPTITAPIGAELPYNGKDQVLIENEPSTNAGVIEYSFDGQEGWSTNMPKAADAYSYTVYWRVVNNNGSIIKEKSTFEAKIKAVSPFVKGEAPRITKQDLVYNGEYQSLISSKYGILTDVAEAAKVNLTYKVVPANSANNEDVEGAVAKNAGDYTVYYTTSDGLSNNFILEENVKVGTKTIDKARLRVTAPKRIRNLTYDGTELQLIEDGSVEPEEAKANLMYAVTDTETKVAPPDSDYTTRFAQNVKGSEAGTYRVWYKVQQTEAELGNYVAPRAAYVDVRIAPQEVFIAWSNVGFDYDGDPHAPIATVVKADKETIVEGLKAEVSGAQTDAGEGYEAIAELAVDETVEIEPPINLDNYVLDSETATIEFDIDPWPVGFIWYEDANYSEEATDSIEYVYNGSPQQPFAIVDPEDLPEKGESVDVIGYSITGDTGWGHVAVNAGEYNAEVVELDNPNYTIDETIDEDASASVDFTIAKATLDDFKATLADWTYGEDPKTPKITGLPWGMSNLVTYEWAEEDSEDFHPYKKGSYPTDAGSYSLRVTVKESRNYESTEYKDWFTIIPKDSEVIAPEAVEGLIYNGEDQELITSGTVEHGIMMYAISEDKPTRSDFHREIPAEDEADTYRVWYGHIATDSNYNQKPQIDGSIDVTIAKKAVSVTWDEESLKQEYTGGLLEPKAEVTRDDGRLFQDRIIVSFKYDQNGPAFPVEIGEYEAKAYLAEDEETDNNNYVIQGDDSRIFTITPATVKLSVQANSRPYDGYVFGTDSNDITVYYTFNGKTKPLPDKFKDSLTLTYSKDFLLFFERKTTDYDGIEGPEGSAPKNEGTYYVKASMEDTSVFKFETSDKQEFAINPKTVEITWDPEGTADDPAALEYNSKEQAPKPTLVTGIEGEELTAVVSGAQRNVGDDYTATVTKFEAANKKTKARNYALPDTGKACPYLIYAKFATIADLVGVDKTYDGTTDAELAVDKDGNTIGTIEGLFEGDDLSFTVTKAEFASKDVNTEGCEVTATCKLIGGDKDNYRLDLVKTTTAKIFPAPVTVTWANDDGCTKAHVYKDGEKHSVGATIDGAVSGEKLSPDYAEDSKHAEQIEVGNYVGKVNGVMIQSGGLLLPAANYMLVNKKGEPITESTYEWAIVNPSPGPSPGPEPTPVYDPVAEVIKLIEALDPNADDYAAKAQEAVDAYDKLTDQQKADDRFKDQDVATKLADAQAEVQSEADKRAAQPVIDMINALNENSTKEDVEAARAAYEALTPAQQLACGPALFKLQSEEYRIYSGEAKAKTVDGFKVKNVKKQKAKCTWKATAGIDGYKITYKAKGVKAKKVYVSASKVKKTIKKLKKDKKYTFKIRTYNEVYNPVYGDFEKVFGKTAKKKVKITK